MSCPASSAFASCGSTVSSYPIDAFDERFAGREALATVLARISSFTGRDCQPLLRSSPRVAGRVMARSVRRERLPAPDALAPRPWALRLGRRRLPAPPFLALGCGAWISREYGERVKLTASWRRRSPIPRFRMPTGLKCASRTTGNRRPRSRLPTARSCTAARSPIAVPRPDAGAGSTFDGIFYYGDVWLDGDYLGATEGYFVHHSFEVTDALSARDDHVLALEVACPPQRDRTAKRTVTGVFGHWDAADTVVQPRRAVATDAHHRDRAACGSPVCGCSAPKQAWNAAGSRANSRSTSAKGRSTRVCVRRSSTKVAAPCSR